MDNPFRAIDARFGLEPLPNANAPIFLLAAGWRSGSTLLQRMVVSSNEVLVWGEPYGRAGLIPALTHVLQTFQPTWPAAGALAPFGHVEGSKLSQEWIANLYPEPTALRDGMRAMLDTWLHAPAQARGVPRFGLKEVRLSVLDAMGLQWFYPDARFVFLVRNPWDAWSSMKGSRWLLRWPDKVVTDVNHFVQVWSGLWRSFLAWDDPAAIRIRFEDLRNPDKPLDDVIAHLRLPGVDPDVRGKQLRGIQNRPTPLTVEEIETIDRVCGEMARAIGYLPPLVCA